MKIGLLGVTIGVALALSLTGFTRGFLFRVPAHDPITFVSIPVFVRHLMAHHSGGVFRVSWRIFVEGEQTTPTLNAEKHAGNKMTG